VTKAVTKYTVNVLSDFMLEKKYDREIGTMDIVALNSILQDLRECQNQQVEIIILKAH
jgi:hypothetical protein